MVELPSGLSVIIGSLPRIDRAREAHYPCPLGYGLVYRESGL